MSETAIFWRNWVFRTHHNECFSPHHFLCSLPTFCCGSKNRLPSKIPSCFETTVAVFSLNSICSPFVILFFLNMRDCHLISLRVEGGKGSLVVSGGTLCNPDKTTPRLHIWFINQLRLSQKFICIFAFLHSPFLNIFFLPFPFFLDIFPCPLVSTYWATNIVHIYLVFLFSLHFAKKSIFKPCWPIPHFLT